MRSASQVPDPHPMDSALPTPFLEASQLHCPLGDRLINQARDIKDCLRPSVCDKCTWLGMFAAGVEVSCVY